MLSRRFGLVAPRRSSRGASSWDLSSIAGLVGWWNNRASVESDAPSALLDVGPSKLNMAVRGLRLGPWRALFGGHPYARVDAKELGYAQAPGTVADYPRPHLDAWTAIFKFAIDDDLDTVRSLLSWGWSGSSNANAAYVYLTTAGALNAGISSTLNAGTQHASTGTGDDKVRTGDVISLVVRSGGGVGETLDLYFVRSPRFDGDPEVIVAPSAAAIGGGPINTGAATGVPTVGSAASLSTFFLNFDLVDFALYSRKISDGERASAIAYLRKTDFDFFPVTSSRPAIYGDLDPDHYHWTDALHAKAGHCLADNARALVPRLGRRGLTVKRASIGDSREVGSSASGDAATCRGVAASDIAGFGEWIDEEVGPVPASYGGRTFAISGGIDVECSLLPSNRGFGPRGGGSQNIAIFMGPGGSYRDVDVFEIGALGVNRLRSTIAAGVPQAKNWIFEQLLITRYVRDAVRSATGKAVGFSMITEPINGDTTTGRVQRATLADCKERHFLARTVESEGSPVALSNLYDVTYNP